MRQHPTASADEAMERLTSRWLELEVGSLPDGPQLPAAIRREVIERVSATPQGSVLSRDRWLGRRPAGWKEKLVFATTGLAVGLALGTVGFAILVPGPDDAPRVPAADATVTHRVAADGSGQFTTIAQALAAASDGDTVSVAPGVYAGHVVIDKDITLSGDGPRADIVIEYGEDGPLTEAGAGEGPMTYGILLQDSDATVRGLTVRSDIQGMAFAIDGGAPHIVDVATIEPADPEGLEGAAFIIRGGSEALIEDSTTVGWVFIEEAEPTLTGNDIANWAYLDSGADPLLRDNRIVGVHLRGASSALIEDNDLTSSPWPEGGAPAIHVQTDGDDSRVIIRGNRIGSRDFGIGIDADRFVHDLTIEGNFISGADIGVRLESAAVLIGNTIRDNVEEGVLIEFGAPILTDNVIEGNAVGLLARNSDARPVLSGNRICDNEVDFSQPRGGPDIDLSGNEVCQESVEKTGLVAPVAARAALGRRTTSEGSPLGPGVELEKLKRGIHRIVDDGADHKLKRVVSAAVDASGDVWMEQGRQVFRLGHGERFGLERFESVGVRGDRDGTELTVGTDGRVISRNDDGAVAFHGEAWALVDESSGQTFEPGTPGGYDQWADFGFISFDECLRSLGTRRQAEQHCGHRGVGRYETLDGTSWAVLNGFGGGISRFEDGVWTSLLPYRFRRDESASELFVDPAGDVWVMLEGRVVDDPRRVDRDGYLARWNGRAWKSFDLPDVFDLRGTRELSDPTRHEVGGIEVTSDGTIWFAVGGWSGTASDGSARLVAFDGKRWKIYSVPRPGGAKSVGIQDLDLLPDGSLLVLVRYARDHGDALFAPLWFKPDVAEPTRTLRARRA